MSFIALAKAGFARRSQSAGGFGEAERSEGAGVRGVGAECAADPFQDSHHNSLVSFCAFLPKEPMIDSEAPCGYSSAR